MTDETATLTEEIPDAIRPADDAPEPATPMEPAPDASVTFAVPPKHYFWGTGRRKTAVARVRVRPGTGKFEVNGRDWKRYFPLESEQLVVATPLRVTDTATRVDVFVNVKGGGTTGQAGAIVMGLARALLVANKEYEPVLREHRLLTRDARQVERKKYGQAGARKRFQFSKR